jgi:transposase
MTIPFWNEQANEISKKLWFPEKNISSYISDKLEETWFNYEYKRNKPIEPIQSKLTSSKDLISMKIKLRLSQKAKSTLRKWNDHYRFTYNKVIEYFNNQTQFSKYDMRDLLVKKSEVQKSNRDFLLGTPKFIRESAVFDAYSQRQSCFTNKNNGNIKRFKMDFKNKKNKSWSFGIPKEAIAFQGDKSLKIYKTILKETIKTWEVLPSMINHNCKIHYDSLDFFLIIPMNYNEKALWKIRKNTSNKPGIFEECQRLLGLSKKKKKTLKLLGKIKKGHIINDTHDFLGQLEQKINEGKLTNNFKDKREEIIAIDPGVRTFLTGYSPQGSIVEIGIDPKDGFARYNKRISYLQKKRKASPEKRKINRLIRITYRKIRYLKEELHNKAGNFLVNNFKTILLPSLNVSDLVEKEKRIFGKGTTRTFLQLSHYQFIQRLITKTKGKNCEYKKVSEEYTSKTCGRCGHIHMKLGASKIFKCPKCLFMIDRDINASRNILILAILKGEIPPIN